MQMMSVLETWLPALLIVLALGIVVYGPARLLRWWDRLRRMAQMVARTRSPRSEALREE